MSSRGVVAGQTRWSGPSCIICVNQLPLHVLDEQGQGKVPGDAYTLLRHAGPGPSCSDVPGQLDSCVPFTFLVLS
jgi:hypothetical protein